MRRNQIIPRRSLATLAITNSNPLPAGQQGAAYSVTFTATGGQGNYRWLLLQDLNGTGLTMNPSTGVLSGTVAAVGLCQFVIGVGDSGGEFVQAMYYATMANVAGLTITTSSPLPSAIIGAQYDTTIVAIGGAPPYTWSILSATPNSGAWISINSSTGDLGGRPNVTTETETIVVQVQDSLGGTASKTFSLVVSLSSSVPNLAALPAGSNDVADWNNFPGKSWAVSTPWTDITGTVLIRLTDALNPTASTSFCMEYATGGPRISLPFGAGLDTYWVQAQYSSAPAVPCVFQVKRNVGYVVGTLRTIPYATGALGTAFSTLPGEQDILYISDRGSPSKIQRYNVNTQAFAPNAVFNGPNASVTAASSQAGWLIVTWNGDYLTWITPVVNPTSLQYMNVHTGVIVTYSGVELPGNIDIRIFKGTSHIAAAATSLLGEAALWWFVDTNVATAPGAGTMSGHSDAGWSNYYSFDPNSGTKPLALQTSGTAPASDGGAWTGTRTNLYNGGGFAVTNTSDAHGSMHWNQGNVGDQEYYCFGADVGGSMTSVAVFTANGWSVDAGNVYKTTVTLTGPSYGSNIRGVTAIMIGSATVISGKLNKVGSRGAVIAGTFYWDGTTVYAWMPNGSNPTGQTYLCSPGLLNESYGYLRADGNDSRRLCFNYKMEAETLYDHRMFANISPDGKIVIFNSNLGNFDGRADLVMAQVPIA